MVWCGPGRYGAVSCKRGCRSRAWPALVEARSRPAEEVSRGRRKDAVKVPGWREGKAALTSASLRQEKRL